jgi:hypothetical protein
MTGSNSLARASYTTSEITLNLRLSYHYCHAQLSCSLRAQKALLGVALEGAKGSVPKFGWVQMKL